MSDTECPLQGCRSPHVEQLNETTARCRTCGHLWTPKPN